MGLQRFAALHEQKEAPEVGTRHGSTHSVPSPLSEMGQCSPGCVGWMLPHSHPVSPLGVSIGPFAVKYAAPFNVPRKSQVTVGACYTLQGQGSAKATS